MALMGDTSSGNQVPPFNLPDPGAARKAGKPKDSTLATQRKEELLGYVKSFYTASYNWRSVRYHTLWDSWDRNFHNIYDPVKKARKQPWQSMMFVGVTVNNVEMITSQIHKTMMGVHPPIQIDAGPAGDDLQAQLMEDALAYEMHKAKYDVNFYDVVKEAVRYGSGFMKYLWNREEDTRTRKVPQMESPGDLVNRLPPEVLNGQAPMQYPSLKGFSAQKVPVLLSNWLQAKYVHIRDIFPEPNSTDWKKVIHRDKISFGWIMDNIKQGRFYDVSGDLENVTEGEQFDADLQVARADRGFTNDQRIRSKYEKKHTVWEFWAPIPRKWIDFEIPDGYEAEQLVPGKVMVASASWLLASEENPHWDGESPILKMDYIRQNEPYGKGVCELIMNEQDEINEFRNLRMDNVNLIMNKMIAILERAIVSRKDLISQPGGIIRLKDQVSDDIRKAIMPIEFPDVTRSAYQETMELERQIQERTGANRMTMGTADDSHDTNRTLGGMELLKQAFNERLAAYGMIIESQFLVESAAKIYGLIYQYLNPDDMKPILGEEPVEIDQIPGPPQMPPMGPDGAPMGPPMMGPPVPVHIPRYLAFAFVPPEEVAKSYKFKPAGIFSMDNKTVKAAQSMDMLKLLMGMPWFNPKQCAEDIGKFSQIPEATKWFIDAPMMPPGMPPPGGPPPGGPPGPVPGHHMGGPPMPQMPAPAGSPGMNPIPPSQRPGMKGGPNGNQPSFLPPRPIRRMPIT